LPAGCRETAQGLLVHCNIDFGKTHDLERFGEMVLRYFPDLQPLIAPVTV